jgi:hypothetical protein
MIDVMIRLLSHVNRDIRLRAVEALRELREG